MTKKTSKPVKKFSGEKSKKDNNDKGIDNDTDTSLLPAKVSMNDEHAEDNFKVSQKVLR